MIGSSGGARTGGGEERTCCCSNINRAGKGRNNISVQQLASQSFINCILIFLIYVIRAWDRKKILSADSRLQKLCKFNVDFMDQCLELIGRSKCQLSRKCLKSRHNQKFISGTQGELFFMVNLIWFWIAIGMFYEEKHHFQGTLIIYYREEN